jgi:hypothetical protein
MKRIYHGTHIYLHEKENGAPCVTTDDYELYDMVEDYLIEDCDLDYECLIRHGWPEKESHTIEVQGILLKSLEKYIQKLDLKEIERIYLINNKQK